MLKSLAGLMSLCALAHALPPPVNDGRFDDYDVASFKQGQWLESESVSEITEKDGTKRVEKKCRRMACVRVEDGAVWIEETEWDPARAEERTVTLNMLNARERRIIRAWRGKAGGEGKETKVFKSLGVMSVNPEGTTVTGAISSDTIKVGDTEHAAQKVVVTTVEPGKDGARFSESFWLCKDLPFPIRWTDKKVLKQYFNEAKLDPPIDGVAALAGVVKKYPGAEFRVTVTAAGMDAKPTLNVEGSDGGEK